MQDEDKLTKICKSNNSYYICKMKSNELDNFVNKVNQKWYNI